MKFKEFIKNPWVIAISVALIFFILGVIFFGPNIQTKGDYSPGHVEGTYRAGDQVSGDKIEAENLTINKFGQQIENQNQQRGIIFKDNIIMNSKTGISMPKNADLEMDGNQLINNEKSVEIRD